MSIIVLDRAVVNKISAGEVVEKPASIVKELLENSIDAGAKNITIDIEDGGIKKIAIQDDGCGIKSEEIGLAFTPHATSKLTKYSDLNSLTTMGFRGEALASISAVSKVTITTKTETEDIATRVILEGGTEIEKLQVASVTGTKIEVEDVFYNTPARLKFLRKPKSEESDITSYVNKIILSHSNINFKYIVNGKLVYNTNCGGLLNNIYTIYGSEFADNLIPVDFTKNGSKVFGYICKPEFCKPNRTYQTLFVNNRYCVNSLVSTACQNAFENFMMKGKFPIYVLFLELPIPDVDVNVHPNKLEVKFANTHFVYGLVNDAICETLYNYNHIRNVETKSIQGNIANDDDIISNEKITQTVITNEDDTNASQKFVDVDYSAIINGEVEYADTIDPEGISFENEEERQRYLRLKKLFDESQNGSNSIEFELSNNLLSALDTSEIDKRNAIKFNDEINRKQCIANENVLNEPKLEQSAYKDLFKKDYILIGKAFNTYLILEQEDRLYLIDQHAGHERIKYDKLIEQIESNTLLNQDLLVPYTFNVSSSEFGFLIENMDLLKSFGIELEEFGVNSFKVSSIPLLLSGINLKEYFDELLKGCSGFARSPKEIIREKFMQMACKSAVKGGDDLKDGEINYLLDVLKRETNVLLCPHGRPIVVEIDKKQIEKWFKRIVS